VFVLLSQRLVAQQNAEPHPVDSLLLYDKLLSVNDMKLDLKLFRNIREKANSGLYRYRTKKQTDSIYNWAYTEIKKPLRTR
jgi:hypothetical protein